MRLGIRTLTVLKVGGCPAASAALSFLTVTPGAEAHVDADGVLRTCVPHLLTKRRSTRTQTMRFGILTAN